MPLTESEIKDMVDSMTQADSVRRAEEHRRQAKAVSYFSGQQWIRSAPVLSNDPDTRLRTSYDPSSTQIRVQDNITTPLTQLAEAATHPLSLPFTIKPYRHLTDFATIRTGQVAEFVMERERRTMRALQTAAYANFMASIVGSWLICLDLVQHLVDVDGQPIPDWQVRWRQCPATDLVLDPACTEPDLRDHDVITLWSVLPLDRIKKMYGVDIDPSKAEEIGRIAKDHVEANRLSGGAIFQEYREFSKTKGAEVLTVYRKSPGSLTRFDERYILVADPEKGRRLVNGDDVRSPFGFDGLGMGKIDWHRRTGSALGQGAAQQIIGDQDLLNLSTTLYTRGLMHSAHPTWLIDEKTLRPDRFRQQYNNRIGGALFYTSRTRHEPGVPPQSIRTPDPSPAHVERMNSLPANARDKLHRSQLNQGVGKSHVPDATSQRLLEESDKVPNLIVEQQAKVYEDLFMVSLTTMRMGVELGSPTMLGRWVEHGFDEQDLLSFKRLDPINPNLELRVPRDAIRPRSPFTRRAEIVEAATLSNPLLTPAEAQFALAKDADLALTGMDDHAIKYTEGLIERVISGEEWEPIPQLGTQHDLVMLAIKKALFSNRNLDEAARTRLHKALELQGRQKNKELAELQQAQEPPQGGAPNLAEQLPAGGLDLGQLVGGQPSLAAG